MQRDDPNRPTGAILSPGEGDEPLEAWTLEELDHFTDLGNGEFD
jgi:hypothetical protein